MKLKVRVPATTANLGPGFDCLGLALDWWNTVEVEPIERGLKVEVDCPQGVDIPRNSSNLVVYGMNALFRLAGTKRPPCRIRMTTRIPIGRGLGSSSAAIVGGLVAGNALLGNIYSRDELVTIATRIEGHPDNVAPALLGGLMVAAMEGKQVTVARFPVPRELCCALFVPDRVLLTRKARSVLPERVPLADAVYNASRVALWIAALRERRWEWLEAATQDRLHQPYRAKLIPGMRALFEAAMKAGARGAAVSGAGPSIIAFAVHHGEPVARAMLLQAKRMGLAGSTHVVAVSPRGAQVAQFR
ncbi:MAG: Homoserine kinase [Acidobacteria bacterium]|nr:Homoserine kinase [Acidobacteriota bacterium]